MDENIYTKIVDGERVILEGKELEDRLSLDARWEAETPMREWEQNIKIAMPSTEKQLEMLYEDQINGTTTWKDTITSVKQQYPKP